MNVISFRTTLAALIVAVCLVPLYAHHGTEFLSKAMEMNTAEVQLAEMALTKAQNPKVKEFAQMVVKDHNQELETLRDLRENRAASNLAGKAGTSTVQLTPEHRRTADKLNLLTGAAFDSEFMAAMVRDHKTEIREYEAQSHAHGYTPASTKQTYSGAGQTTRQKPATPDQKTYSPADLDRDFDTAEFATTELPVLKRHLQQAEEIQKQLKTK